jgi:signal transduction histidine kinase
MLSSPLRDDLTSVGVVRNRVLAASVIAVVFALVLGWGLATLFARRIRRLDNAAGRIADGHFETPIVDSDPDELGQLARSFERMRVRLESLDRARAEFIANASHELRTPLFSLGGFLELLASEELDAETRSEFMTAIRGQVTRLTKLATDLLDLSKLDADAMEIRTEPVELAELAGRISAEFTPAAERHDSPIAVRPGRRAVASADPDRVAQIMRILIDNALTHTPEGTSIAVSADTSDGTASLVVADDGPGVDARSRGRIFERFYTVDRVRGSGLGLAIARELANRMGGEIDLASRRGRTRFTLRLPSSAGSARA